MRRTSQQDRCLILLISRKCDSDYMGTMQSASNMSYTARAGPWPKLTRLFWREIDFRWYPDVTNSVQVWVRERHV